jgi:ParB/RepB/Spo0J family partition protein
MSNVYIVPLKSIRIDRDERQRRDIDVSDLVPSIQQWGLLQPLVVRGDGEHYVLIAGERRLTACQELALETVPVTLFSELSLVDAQLIELEENVKRKDLPWRDYVSAVGKVHQLLLSKDPEHSQTATSRMMNISGNMISRILRVFRDLDSPRIATASSMEAAFNALARQDERRFQSVMGDILEAVPGIKAVELDEAEPEALYNTIAEAVGEGPLTAPAPRPTTLAPSPLVKIDPIHQVSFIDWAPTYAGKRFNFIHCDFPYGIDFNKGSQGGRNDWAGYDDSPDVYWALLRALCDNAERLFSPSAHMVFWFSMDYYTETIDFFAKHLPQMVINKHPLYWVKSDNVGVLPDPTRGPRRIVETALLGSLGDRKIVRSVSNAYSAPTDKTIHQSTKPEPMLRHFFQMFVDDSTVMLDPTAGSGAALRAADAMGAEQVLGLEINPEHCVNANEAFRLARRKREMAK